MPACPAAPASPAPASEARTHGRQSLAPSARGGKAAADPPTAAREEWEGAELPASRRPLLHIASDLALCAVTVTMAGCALGLAWYRTTVVRNAGVISLWEGLQEMGSDSNTRVRRIATAATAFISMELAVYSIFMMISVATWWLPGLNGAARYGWMPGLIFAIVAFGLVLGVDKRYGDSFTTDFCSGLSPDSCTQNREAGYWLAIVATTAPVLHGVARLVQDCGLPPRLTEKDLRHHREEAQRRLTRTMLDGSKNGDDDGLLLLECGEGAAGCCFAAPAEGPPVLVAGGAEGSVWIYPLPPDGEEPMRLQGAHGGAVAFAVPSAGGTVVTVGAEDCSARTWTINAAEGVAAAAVQRHAAGIDAIWSDSQCNGAVVALRSRMVIVPSGEPNEPADCRASFPCRQRVRSISALPAAAAGRGLGVYFTLREGGSAVWHWAADTIACPWRHAPKGASAICVAAAPAVPSQGEPVGREREQWLWGARVYAGCSDGAVRSWPARRHGAGQKEGAAAVQVLGAPGAPVTAVAVSGQAVVVGHADGAVVVSRRDGWPMAVMRTCSGGAAHVAACATHVAACGAAPQSRGGALCVWGMPQAQQDEPQQQSVSRRRARIRTASPTPVRTTAPPTPSITA
eukprot:TRINITY_DN5038_c0_g1_i1.p1 TRINITY_DN5038_c0_g1~~TRINITY_DN5038_c0_g1_i1.p1  ORF type:complete len:666 (+),score=200.23 TRINITY_DN5038_c0_g1_i1:113-1999(+)